MSDNKKFLGAIFEYPKEPERTWKPITFERGVLINTNDLSPRVIYRDLFLSPNPTERETLGWVFTVASAMLLRFNTLKKELMYKDMTDLFQKIDRNRIKLFKQLLMHHAPIRKYIKNHIKEINASIEKRVEERRKHDKNSPAWAWEDIHIEDLVKYKTDLEKALIITKTLQDNPTITDADIEKAKDYDITMLVDFENNFSKCLWHDEKTGSMKYYPQTNSVYCFGCGKSADAISVYRKVNNCDFITAVKFLIK